MERSSVKRLGCVWLGAVLSLAGCSEPAVTPVEAGADASTGLDAGGGDDAGSVDAARADTGRCEDLDGDGASDAACGGTDCDDTAAAVHPGAVETCDAAGVDEDCDPTTLGSRDADSDGAIDAACCNGTTCGTDCDDARATVHPTAPESCNAVDDDCDGATDESVSVAVYRDADGDLHGAGAAVLLCADTAGYSTASDDCNDGDVGVHPGATEICNGRDEDCDTTLDEGATITVYRDFDGDGFGDPTASLEACTLPTGYLAAAGDCNDRDALVHPGAAERCNGIDDSCNATIDETCGCTPDGSIQACGTMAPSGGFLRVGACHPGSQSCGSGMWGACTGAVSPVLESCNGIDDDCDGTVDETTLTACYVDSDGDSYAPSGAAPSMQCACTSTQTTRVPVDAGSTDCDDARGSVRPGGTEVCNGLDDNCSGAIDEGVGATFYRDLDGDGYGAAASGTVSACSASTGYVADNSDCDDACMGCHPGGTEICDARDDDCNGMTDENLFGTCTVGLGACARTGQMRCGGGCTASAGTPDSGWHTTAAPNGSWDWNCDGVVQPERAVTDATHRNADGFCATQSCSALYMGSTYVYWGGAAAVGLVSTPMSAPYCGQSLWILSSPVNPQCSRPGSSPGACDRAFAAVQTAVEACH